ncbi:MAG: DUF2784 domain-containing protein [Desulfobacterales bacterium]|nr:DUF2784 domain-containing protein [Desulfobacterales bacterium]
MNQALADIILVIHALFIAFVVIGLALIVSGGLRRWPWVKNFWFRLAHLLAIGLVTAEVWLGRVCPLTIWENRLRDGAEGTAYPAGFIQYWLNRLIYCDLPPWVFQLAYTLFAILVVLAWVLVRPRSPWRNHHRTEREHAAS